MKSWTGMIGMLGIIMLLSACSGKTHEIGEETLSKEGGKTYSNLLVIGAYDNRQYRISAEVLFAEVMKEQGVSAHPSYDILPALKTLKNNNEVAEKLKGTDYDGVLIVSLLEEGYDYDLGDYYATKGFVYLLGGRPGRATELGSFIAWAGSGSYNLYVGLWDAGTLKPVWEITTDSQTTGSDTEDNKALAEFVAARLQSEGLVKLKSK